MTYWVKLLAAPTNIPTAEALAEEVAALLPNLTGKAVYVGPNTDQFPVTIQWVGLTDGLDLVELPWTVRRALYSTVAVGRTTTLDVLTKDQMWQQELWLCEYTGGTGKHEGRHNFIAEQTVWERLTNRQVVCRFCHAMRERMKEEKNG